MNRYIQTHADFQDQAADIAAGFEQAVVDVLIFKIIRAAEAKKCRHIALVGGVAAVQRLQEPDDGGRSKKGLTLFLPSIAPGDNAAMIAASGYAYLKRSGKTGGIFGYGCIQG
ncbi:MAG: hypothetical protein R2874_14800 [Desulfobacterales bacterium]